MILEKTPVLWTDRDTALLGESSAPWLASGVSIDSRTIKPGDLFIALIGPSFDGHDFIDQAEAGGAAVVMGVRDKVDLPNLSIPALLVDDTMLGLERLARLARTRSSASIVGVTGSVGKTSVKEALRLALAGSGEVYATEGNLNNHWGLPLSLTRLPKNSIFGIFEMGMSAPNEISPLSKMAQPHAAIITQIAEVHMEYFESLEQISTAKAEIFEGLVENGSAVLNRDHHLFKNLVEIANRCEVAEIFTFGEHKEADARLLTCRLYETSSYVEAIIAGHRICYEIGAAGKHHVINSLSVLAAVHAIGADLESAAAALKYFRAQKGRGKLRTISWNGGALVLIDESYNASPIAMEAAINVLSATKPKGAGRRIAVIGDMLELGTQSEELHAKLAGRLFSSGIDLVFTAGLLTTALWERLPSKMRGGHAPNTKELAPLVMNSIGDGDIIMVKGSLGSQMTEIVRALDTLESGVELFEAVNGA